MYSYTDMLRKADVHVYIYVYIDNFVDKYNTLHTYTERNALIKYIWG